MSAQSPPDVQERSFLHAAVSVAGRRWRRLPNADALRAAASDSPVYILDATTGIVRFGDGLHGAQPSTGALVRVHYRQGGRGAAGDVAVSWQGRWPPRPFALAKSMAPSCLACDQPDAGQSVRPLAAQNAARDHTPPQPPKSR
jgi:hypothetical protein